jgi:hypothetical protein
MSSAGNHTGIFSKDRVCRLMDIDMDTIDIRYLSLSSLVEKLSSYLLEKNANFQIYNKTKKK